MVRPLLGGELGLDYAVVTGAVLLGMAIVLFLLQRTDRLRGLVRLVAVVGLVYTVVRALSPALNTALKLGTEHANGDVATQTVLGFVLTVLGLAVTIVLLLSMLGGRLRMPRLLPPLPSPDDPIDDEPTNSVPEPLDEPLPHNDGTAWLPWLGLAGLALVILVHAPSPVRLHGFGPGGRGFVASFAFGAFALGIAAVGLLFETGDLGVIGLVVLALAAPGLGLLVSLADSRALLGLLAGIAAGLLLPVGIAVIGRIVADHSLRDLLTPIAAGVVILVAAALAQGWMSHYDNGPDGRGFFSPVPAPTAGACLTVPNPTGGGSSQLCPPTNAPPAVPVPVQPCPSPSPAGDGLMVCPRTP